MTAAQAPQTKTENKQKIKFSQHCPASSVSELRILQREGDPGRQRLPLNNCIQNPYGTEKQILITQAISVLAYNISQEFQMDTSFNGSVVTMESPLITSLRMIAFPLLDEPIKNTFLCQRFCYTFLKCLKYSQTFHKNGFYLALGQIFTIFNISEYGASTEVS